MKDIVVMSAGGCVQFELHNELDAPGTRSVERHHRKTRSHQHHFINIFDIATGTHNTRVQETFDEPHAQNIQTVHQCLAEIVAHEPWVDAVTE